MYVIGTEIGCLNIFSLGCGNFPAFSEAMFPFICFDLALFFIGKNSHCVCWFQTYRAAIRKYNMSLALLSFGNLFSLEPMDSVYHVPRGVHQGKLGRGVRPSFPKPLPYVRPKSAIFPTPCMTWKSSFSPKHTQWFSSARPILHWRIRPKPPKPMKNVKAETVTT